MNSESINLPTPNKKMKSRSLTNGIDLYIQSTCQLIEEMFGLSTKENRCNLNVKEDCSSSTTCFAGRPKFLGKRTGQPVDLESLVSQKHNNRKMSRQEIERYLNETISVKKISKKHNKAVRFVFRDGSTEEMYRIKLNNYPDIVSLVERMLEKEEKSPK